MTGSHSSLTNAVSDPGPGKPKGKGGRPGSSPEVLLELEGMKLETDADRWLAKLAIDHKLATTSEVLEAVKKARKGGLFKSAVSLAEAMVLTQAITPGQRTRLEEEIATKRAGRTIPGFAILGDLGKGTSASVFKARQESLDRIVAVKILHPKSISSKTRVDAFYEEGRAAAQLNHSSIVQAYDVGRHGELLYFVMEFVDGRNVHELLKEHGPFDETRALDIVIDIAEGLEHAHAKGLIHRDVKPKNIMILREPPGDGRRELAKLADLGLARYTYDQVAALRDQGRALGTPYYISPEQVRGDLEIGPATDIYSLGATWHHMVTGRPLFSGESAQEVMDKHLSEPIPCFEEANPGLDPGLGEIITTMVAKEPAKRYASCEELLAELRAWRTVLDLKAGEVERQAG